METQKHEFKAEIRQLLDIITHSIYTNREIFLRELISNASDALDKLRFLQGSGQVVRDPDLPLEIRISTDKEKGVLTISDTGVGLTAAEAIESIGTIAKSGSAEFLQLLQEEGQKSPEIIGRFGVGFYSVFMVGREVRLTSHTWKEEGEGIEPIVWTSDGSGSYELSANQNAEVKRGLTLEIFLKNDALDFADPDKVRSIISKHSNFVAFPIFVNGVKINTIPALWREPKGSVAPEDYKNFYNFLTFDSEEPLTTIHTSVDAPVQFSALLFIPKRELNMFGTPGQNRGLDLYVRRVLIQKDNKDLIPEFLAFTRGVVDTEDLPLNISRETLQENLVVRKIGRTLTKQILSHLQKMAKDNPVTYEEFWKAHSSVFKLGYGDFSNKDTYAELLRFDSSFMEGPGKLASFDDYISRAKEGQKEIYYLLGSSREALELNPHLEIFRAKGLEVLYLYEPVDEFAMEGVRAFKDFSLKSADNVSPQDLDSFAPGVDPSVSIPEPLTEEQSAVLEKMLDKFKEYLGPRVEDVKVSARLYKSPACLVSKEGHLSSGMQKFMRLITRDNAPPVKILEVNGNHPLVRGLLKIFAADPADPFINMAAEQVFESALLLDGYLDDPHKMVSRINELLEKACDWQAQVRGLA